MNKTIVESPNRDLNRSSASTKSLPCKNILSKDEIIFKQYCEIERLKESISRFLKHSSWLKYKRSVSSITMNVKNIKHDIHCGTISFIELERALNE